MRPLVTKGTAREAVPRVFRKERRENE